MRTYRSTAFATCLSLTMLLSTIVVQAPAGAQEIVWRSYQELAQKHLKSGNLDMAERLSLEAVDVAEKIPPHHGVLVESLKLLADIYQAEKKQADYEKTLTRITAAEKKDAETPATTTESTAPKTETATGKPETTPTQPEAAPEPAAAKPEAAPETVVAQPESKPETAEPTSTEATVVEPSTTELSTQTVQKEGAPVEAPGDVSVGEGTTSGASPDKASSTQP
jgi:hypothetical protein